MEEKKTRRIILAGGGTGGHIFPAIAIANALRKLAPGTDILFVGARGKMEMEKVPQAGYPVKGLEIAGFNRSSLFRNIGLPFKLIKSFRQVRSILREFRPDAVVGVGGYSSFPVVRQAQAKNIKTFIHESNSFAGKSNMLLGKRATVIFTASDGMEKFFPREKILVTGNPVRKNIVDATVSRTDAAGYFGLDAGRKTVLAIGGSLGARSINEAIAKHIDAFEQNGLQLIWQTGKTTVDRFRPLQEGRRNIWIGDFITDMSRAYGAADMIVSRSGSTVYELCVVGKPAILVPYPFAAEDHQTANAMNLVRKKAAIMIPDAEADERLVPAVVELAANAELQQELSEHISSLAITNADEVIAQTILKAVN